MLAKMPSAKIHQRDGKLAYSKKATGRFPTDEEVLATLVTYALVLLHIGATGWHVAVRRDGVPFRMLPEQNGWASLIRPRWGRIHAASEPEPTSRHPVSLIATKDRGSPTDPPP
jgi:hypothetical protein